MRSAYKEFIEERAFNTFNAAFLTFWLLIILYPLVFIVSSSFSSTSAVLSGKVWLFPVEPSLAGYKAVFGYRKIWSGYSNTIFYTVVGTAVNVAMTILAAYPLSRRDFRGRGFFTFFFTFTMLFNGGLIPTYLTVMRVGLLDTRWALIIPNALTIWNVIVARTYFQHTIPEELLEASRIDGCGDIRFLVSVVLPLSGPILAVITLFYAVDHWNSFFSALIYLKDQARYPLQMILREILIQNTVTSATMSMDVSEQAKIEGLADLMRYSLIIVASVPVLLIYPFVQRYFVQGVMIGALKG